MKRYSSRFVKTVRCLTLSVLLLLSLSINVFAAEGGGTVNIKSTQYYYTNNGFLIPKSITVASGVPTGSDLYLGVSQTLDFVDVSGSPYVQIDFAYTFSAAFNNNSVLEDLPFDLSYYSKENYLSTTGFQPAISELNPVYYLSSSFLKSASDRGICSFVLDRDTFQSMLVTTGATNRDLYLFYKVASSVYSGYSSSNAIFLMSVKQTWTTEVQVDADLEFKLNEISSQLNRIDSALGSIDEGINGNYVDQDEINNIENTVGDHEAAEAEVQDALNNILDAEYEDSQGNLISVSFDDGFLTNLENTFNFQISGESVLQASYIFRKTLGGYIGLFGPFLFLPLVLGLFGALLGRPHGA